MAKQATAQSSFAFFDFLRQFYTQNRGRIRNRYKDLTKKFLDYNDKSKNPNAYLREPQFEALEIYVFLKEFCNNPQIYDLFDKWYNRVGDFAAETVYTVNKGGAGQMSLFDLAAVNYKAVFDYMRKGATSYPNYIYALTMGLGKTVLMATCIFYEFLLANKYPKDTRYCHNALVFAPDKTVLQSLREIVTMDKEKVVPSEYCRVLDQNIKFHFLDDTGITLNTLDNSDFNIIISNTQKIIKKRVHKEKTPIERLLEMSNAPQNDEQPTDIISSILGSVYTEENTRDEGELLSNQRFEKLTRLEQLGIYVDEAHHLFGGDLQKSMNSLRLTINELAAALKESGTRVVACYNYTGTPYLENTVLPEVVYSYGLKEAIANKYLKDVDIKGYDNVKSETFLKTVIEDFWNTYGGNTYEGLPPKLAIFGATIEEVVNEIRPAVEKVLSELGIPLDKILVNTGDTTVTKDNDIKAFNDLDVVGTIGSQKQFILLCNKGREGWNCRSLFGVALFRSPKSTIFVLQATMRCLRQITDNQQKAIVRLSKENMDILDAELAKNFRVSISEISNSGDGKHKELYKVKLLKPQKLLLKRISHKYSLLEKGYTAPIDFGINGFDFDKYETHVYEKESLTDQRTVKKSAVELGGNREYSSYMLVAEIAKYARQDREVSSRLFTLKSFAKVINSLDFIEVEYYDPHSDVAKALIDRGSFVYSPFMVSYKDCAVMYPDAGAAKKYGTVEGVENPIIGNKHRNEEGRIDSYELVNFIEGTKKVIIRDDICSYGGTFVAAAKELRKRGVEEIVLVVTHCENAILKGEVFEYIDRVFTTDSILTVSHPKITIARSFRKENNDNVQN